MKKLTTAIICMLVGTVCVTGCAAKNEIPNPMVGANTAEFEKLGIRIDAPAGAEDVKYFIIGGELAHIAFVLNGRSFIYRCSDDTDNDISGVYARFEDTALSLNAEYADGAVEVLIRTTTEGGRLANWEKDGQQYSLYTKNEMSDDEISALCLALCEA